MSVGAAGSNGHVSSGRRRLLAATAATAAAAAAAGRQDVREYHRVMGELNSNSRLDRMRWRGTRALRRSTLAAKLLTYLLN